MPEPIQLYSDWLKGMSEYGKTLFEKLYNKIMELEGVYPEPQEKSGHITFKLARPNRKKGSRFCCIHPASVPHSRKATHSRATSMTLHINNRSQRLPDNYDLILQYTKFDNKNSGYALINISNEEEVEKGMELIKQCHALLKNDLEKIE